MALILYDKMKLLNLVYKIPLIYCAMVQISATPHKVNETATEWRSCASYSMCPWEKERTKDGEGKKHGETQ